MANMNNDSMNNNDYRSAPSRPGPAHDERSIGRMDIRNDNVSVINSGESDPMPNADAQAAYADDELEDANGLRADASNPSEHNPGADSITAIDDPNLELMADMDDVPMAAASGNPENPTAAAGADVGDDENDFEYQQQLGEESGPVTASA